jgi:hypothetical protein
MITSIIFSKDRALQLDLTLKTIRDNFSESSTTSVLYKTSSDKHDKSYENLKLEYPEVVFVKQSTSIFFDVMLLVNNSTTEYVCFFTDDDIVYNSVNISDDQLNNVFNVGCCCLSLRLGINTIKRDYGDGVLRNDSVPRYNSLPPFIVWNRTGIPVGGYWSYPLSVDGHIFKKDVILGFCTELEVLQRHYEYKGVPREHWCWKQTPNEFEAKLQRFWFDLPPLMASFEHSCVVNSPNNRVQEHVENRSGDTFSYSATDLNEYYLNGKRLNVQKINFNNIVCPHQELDILKGLE